MSFILKRNQEEYIGQFSFNKVNGLGFFKRNGMYELGVYTNKVKNGVFFDITNSTIYIRRYINGNKQVEEFILDATTFNLTYKTSYDNIRNYLFNNCFMV